MGDEKKECKVVKLIQPKDAGDICKACHFYYPCREVGCSQTGVHGWCYVWPDNNTVLEGRPACTWFKRRAESTD
jgi:hypothetical protein